MEPMYLSIQQKETGRQIKRLLSELSLDNFIILSRLLHTSIEDILVIDGDIVRLWYILFRKLN